MATLRVNSNSSHSTVISVRESDVHSEQVYIEFTREFNNGHKERFGEMFCSPKQLEFLGRFLVRQADEIQTEQSVRKETT